MRLCTVPLAIALLASPIAAELSSHTLHHRIHHTSLLNLPYSELGTVLISDDGSTSFQPSSSLSEDFSSFSQSINNLDGPITRLYYQIALEREGVDQSLWDFTSLKAVCNLSPPLSLSSQTNPVN